MVSTPVYMPWNEGDDVLAKEVFIEFERSPGFAASQKQKSIRALHAAAADAGIAPILEVSRGTRSQPQRS